MSHQREYNFFIPICISSFIIIIFAIYYFPILEQGSLLRWDEYFTLERSTGFARHNDWLTVYTNNSPNFHKPPLQYWITSIFFHEIQDMELALRFLPFTYGLLLLCTVGLLAHAISPEKPYAIPAAITIMSGSSLLWHYSVSAMLDTGAAFYLSLTIAAFLLALRNPKWWYLVAIGFGLGSLHKAPTALLAILFSTSAVYFFRNYFHINFKNIFFNIHFKRSSAIALFLVTFWPIIQTAKYGKVFFRDAYMHQMYERFSPTLDPSVFQIEWLGWLYQNNFYLWLPAILALAILPILYRRVEFFIPVLLVALFCLAMTLASGRVFERYLLQVFPLLAAVLGVAMAMAIPGRATVLGAAVLLAGVAGSPLQTVESLGLEKGSQPAHIPFLQEFARALGEHETPVRCIWNKKWGRIYPGAIHYYAGNGRPFHILWKPEEFGEVTSPCRGICHKDLFDELSRMWPGLEIVSTTADVVHWVRREGSSTNATSP